MIWFYLWIIATIAAIIYGLYIGDSVLGKIVSAIGLGFLAGFVGMFIMYGLEVICYSPSDELKLTETQKIYSLKDNTYLSGRGNFISVKVGEDDKYTYVAVNDDGTYSKKVIESENVKIKEVDNCEEPVLEMHRRESKNQFWSIDFKDYYCFVVPKGTVVNTFEIDLE